MSNAASFCAKFGSPAFPKIDSTKSKLLTKLPGAKKRTSIDFLVITPFTSGHTIGLKSIDTIVFALFSWLLVNGSIFKSSDGLKAAFKKWAKVIFGTSFLSNGTGKSPSTIWKVPFVVLLSFNGLFKIPCFILLDVTSSLLKVLPLGGKLTSLACPFLDSINVLLGSL